MPAMLGLLQPAASGCCVNVLQCVVCVLTRLLSLSWLLSQTLL